MGAHLLSQQKGDARNGSVSPFYLTPQKRLSTEYSPQDARCASLQRCLLEQIHYITYLFQRPHCGPDARSAVWSTSCLTSSNHLDCRGFKSITSSR
jgi:hypothetical protein